MTLSPTGRDRRECTQGPGEATLPTRRRGKLGDVTLLDMNKDAVECARKRERGESLDEQARVLDLPAPAASTPFRFGLSPSNVAKADTHPVRGKRRLARLSGCRGRDSNPHAPEGTPGFKPGASHQFRHPGGSRIALQLG
jgi:hypothetical protein